MTQQEQVEGEPSRALSTEPNPMKRVAFASFIGTAIEFYDFYIYGTAAALIFPHVFFPNMGPTMATISSSARSRSRSCPARSVPRCSATSEIDWAARRL